MRPCCSNRSVSHTPCRLGLKLPLPAPRSSVGRPKNVPEMPGSGGLVLIAIVVGPRGIRGHQPKVGSGAKALEPVVDIGVFQEGLHGAECRWVQLTLGDE